MKPEKKPRTASLNIRKARALDALEKLDRWRPTYTVELTASLREKYDSKIRALYNERDAAIANVPEIVGVKYQERYVKLMGTLDEDVREAIESEAV